MTHDSPLFLQKVECPICKAINEYETIKVGAYEEGGRDSDFRPTGIKWKNPKYQKFNPILFFMASCSNCFFTREFTGKFKDWKNDSAFRNFKLKTLKEKHSQRFAEDNGIVKMLGETLDYQEYPLQTAINKLLLGVFDELLLERPAKMDVARYFLRIAWLFREAADGGTCQQDVSMGFLSDLESEVGHLDTALQNIDVRAGNLGSAVNSHLSNTKFGSDNIADELQKGYGLALGFLAGTKERLESAIKQFRDSIAISRDAMVATEVDDLFSLPFGRHSSYREYLLSAREQWDLVPVSEHDALNQSFQFYKSSYETGHEVSAGNQQIQVEYLMGDLCRRMGHLDDARTYFNSAIRSAQEFIYQHKGDKGRTALASKIREMALTQGKLSIKETQ